MVGFVKILFSLLDKDDFFFINIIEQHIYYFVLSSAIFLISFFKHLHNSIFPEKNSFGYFYSIPGNLIFFIKRIL